MARFLVVKSNGHKEPFSEEKVIRSMRRVGVDQKLQDKALRHILDRLKPETPTSEIFHHISEFLDQNEQQIPSIRLNLKHAMFALGPTGYPFEKYIQRIFQNRGYAAETNLTLQGDCVTHEIDVMIEKDSTKEIIEAKFHNQKGVKTDIQVALYSHARFLDVSNKHSISKVWIITNTKLSQDAIEYTRCKGINALAWNYPEKNNLQDAVEEPLLYPVTILDTLTDDEKRRLLENNIVLCSDLVKTPKEKLLLKFLLSEKTIENSKKTARKLCNIT